MPLYCIWISFSIRRNNNYIEKFKNKLHIWKVFSNFDFNAFVFLSSRLHWPERGLCTTPASTNAKGLSLLCSSVFMLWVSMSLCLSLSLSFLFHRSRGFTSRVESVMALQISHSAVSIKANNPPTLTANSFVIQSLLGCLPVSSFQTPLQRQGQSADWLVSPPRCGGTITMSLTGSRASLFCSTAFIHVDHNDHSSPCETLWPYEPCQLIVLLDISTLPVPGALKEVLRSG